MTIVERLKGKKEDKMVLSAYVDKETGELISIGAAITEGEIEAKTDRFDFELIEPTFQVLSEAMKALYSSGGEVDTIRSGAVVFDACYLGNEGMLEDIKKHASLYLSLCAKCAEKVEIAYIDFKKK